MKTILWVLCMLFVVGAARSYALCWSETGELNKSFTVAKGGRLEVGVESGDIRIVTWDKNEVAVNVQGISDREAERVKMTQSGNTVSVRYRSKWNWGFGSSHNAHFEVKVPSQFDLDLETSGGNLEIRGSIAGTVKGQTSGGDIRLEDVTGSLEMRTSGGDVTAKKIQGDGILRTSGGDIKVGNVSGELEVVTSGGDIRVEDVGKNLTAKTAGGDITIGDVGGEATASTAGGDVKVGKVSGKASLSTAGGDIECHGASGIVTSKTAGGDIRLANISGSVEAKTAGGDVFAELIPSGKGKSRLASSGGDVKLFLPENAKANIEARIRVHGMWVGEGDEYEIRSDFKSDTYEKDSESDEIRASYVLNGGGETITLSTVNANIEIRKLKK